MKRFVVMACSICVVSALLLGTALAESKGFTVSGRIAYSGEGKIRVFLVNETLFRKQGVGHRELMLLPDENAKGVRRIGFKFSDIPAGTYGIRCYQDENGNGKLDRGLFGRPAEPWGMSFIESRPFGRPSFADIAFQVRSDVHNMKIVLE